MVKIKKKCLVITLLLCLLTSIPCISNAYSKTKYYDSSYTKTMYTNSSKRLRPSKYCTKSNTRWSTSNSKYATINKYGTIYTKGYSNKTVYITGIRRSSKYRNVVYRYTYKIYINSKDNNQYITKNIVMVYNDETGGNMHLILSDIDSDFYIDPVSYTNSNKDVAYYTDELPNRGLICATDTGKTTIKLTYQNVDNDGYIYLTYNINVVYVHNTPADIQKDLEKKLGHSVNVWDENAYSLENPIVRMYCYSYEVGDKEVRGYVNSNSLKTYEISDDGYLPVWFPDGYGCSIK